jgi:2-iminobutanoate/2-iminopropanoate deaminase
MLKTSNPKTIAPPAAMYSHSVEVPPNARWLYTAGQVGVRPDGTLPDGFEAQHDQIWRNTLAILADAGMGPENIVRLNVYSTDPDGLKFVKSHREKYLKPGHSPSCYPQNGDGCWSHLSLRQPFPDQLSPPGFGRAEIANNGGHSRQDLRTAPRRLSPKFSPAGRSL